MTLSFFFPLRFIFFFRPVNIRVVEHEDFIDYELDFVEDDGDGDDSAHESEDASERKIVLPRRVQGSPRDGENRDGDRHFQAALNEKETSYVRRLIVSRRKRAHKNVPAQNFFPRQ